MPSLTRRAFATGLVAAALPLPFVRRAAAAPKPLTVASLMADDKPETKIWLKIRDLVEAKLPGRFAFRIVGNAALGGEKEVAEGLRLGSIQATVTTVSALATWVPETQILDLPFVFADRAHARRAVDGPVGVDLRRRLAAQGFATLAHIDYGARHLLAKVPATTPASVAGKRIRVIQSPLHVELWKAYGALPTPLPITETWNALKSGVVDMMDLTKSAYAGFKLYEVVPVLVETAHIRATGVVHLAASFWAGLSDEEKRVFTDAAREGALYFDDLIEADEAASMAVAIAAGGRMVPAENRDAWIDGARTVWAALAPKLGGLDRIEALARA
jgi:TRAP-type C4-dicarboxylate transport system substrate-binding protein